MTGKNILSFSFNTSAKRPQENERGLGRSRAAGKDEGLEVQREEGVKQ